MEARPVTMGAQTDFYLQLGQEGGSSETIPGNVWFQFWIYTNHYDDPTDQNDQLSLFGGRFKCIYPCRGAYPCSEPNITWLNAMGSTSSEPFWVDSASDYRQLYLTTTDPYNVAMDYQLAADYNQYKLGQTDISENIRPNRWTLVKIHYDTSTTSGAYEAWLKPRWPSGSTDRRPISPGKLLPAR